MPNCLAANPALAYLFTSSWRTGPGWYWQGDDGALGEGQFETERECAEDVFQLLGGNLDSQSVTPFPKQTDY
jgi:hypothetical protein